MVTKVERMIAQLQKEQLLSVTFRDPDFSQIQELENTLNTKSLSLERLEIAKDNNHLMVTFKISGKKKYLVEMEFMHLYIPRLFFPMLILLVRAYNRQLHTHQFF
ncbi:hypothetical protein SAMN05421820_104153 [Pedobacter steynii]|uniref:Uncharacterized protein n=1 Tax=Pedobacter steynii TaxID=430522 RepID=A0A1G9UEW1_9SPHI|nr:hypothetical protein SAMN05421820_104153 [Pedobacter steynii]